jgi:hypothetical protein
MRAAWIRPPQSLIRTLASARPLATASIVGSVIRMFEDSRDIRSMVFVPNT